MDLYITGYKKQYFDENKAEWRDTDYSCNKVAVFAESLEEATKKTKLLIEKFYSKEEGKYRGVINKPTREIDGLFFVDAYGGEYTTGVVL